MSRSLAASTSAKRTYSFLTDAEIKDAVNRSRVPQGAQSTPHSVVHEAAVIKAEPSFEAEEVAEEIRDPPAKTPRNESPAREDFGSAMAEAYMQVVGEKDIAAEKRIWNLVSALKDRAKSFKLSYEKLQLLVGTFIDKLIVDKNWSNLTVDKALALSVFGDFEAPLEKVDWFKCNLCETSYPPGKYRCGTCGDKFTNQIILLAHRMTAHQSSVDCRDFFCKSCNLRFGKDPRSFAIHLREKHLCTYNHIECPRNCGILIVERHVDSVMDHISEMHECGICKENILLGNSKQHKLTFHGSESEADLPNGKRVNGNWNHRLLSNRSNNTHLPDVEMSSNHVFHESSKTLRDRTSVQVPRQGRVPEKVSSLSKESALTRSHGSSREPTPGNHEGYRDLIHARTSISPQRKAPPRESQLSSAGIQHAFREAASPRLAPYDVATPESSALNAGIGIQRVGRGVKIETGFGEVYDEQPVPEVPLVSQTRFDLSKVKSYNVQVPIWKACKQCPFVSNVRALYVCELCPSSKEPFVTSTELVLHVSRFHGCEPNDHLFCALCLIDFNSVDAYAKHRSEYHRFCAHHIPCLTSDDCHFLFGSLENAKEHSKNGVSNCAIKRGLKPSGALKRCSSCFKAFSPGEAMSCFFCEDINMFVSENELLLHLMKDHGCNIAGTVKCNECQTNFDSPVTWGEHTLLKHEHCYSHKFCPNSKECDVLFAQIDRECVHDCSFQRLSYQQPRGRDPEPIPLDSMKKERYQEAKVFSKTLPFPEKLPFQVSNPPKLFEMGTAMSKNSRPISGSSSRSSRVSGILTPPPKERPDLDRVLARNRLGGREHSSGPNGHAARDKGYGGSGSRPSREVLRRESAEGGTSNATNSRGERIDADQCAPMADEETYLKAKDEFGVVYSCHRCNMDSKTLVKSSVTKCDACTDVWFTYRYELDAHKAEIHGVSELQEYPITCNLCSGRDVFETYSPYEMVNHKRARHQYEVHFFCLNEQCSMLFHSVEVMSSHFNSISSKSSSRKDRCYQLLDGDFEWRFKTGNVYARSYQKHKRVTVMIQCFSCNFEMRVSVGKNHSFSMCNICTNQRAFAVAEERFWHYLREHGKHIGGQKYYCKFCSDEMRYDHRDSAHHRREVHGFCTEHYICKMRNCFYVTSNARDYDRHVQSCRDQETPKHCKVLKGESLRRSDD